MNLTFKTKLDSVKANQHAKYLTKEIQKATVQSQTYTQWTY